MTITAYFEFASKPSVLAATLVATAVLLVAFPAIPVGGPLLDTLPAYGHAEAMAALAGYGPDGRSLYAWSSATLDTLLPAVYATFLAGAIHRYRPARPASVANVLPYLPLAVGALDLAENVQIIAMLLQFPDVSPGQAASASACTTAKTVAFLACLSLALILAGAATVRRLVAARSQRR